MSTKLRVSFLRPIDLDTPLPVHSESDQVISAAGIRVYRHSATANSNEKQRLALRAFVAQSEGDNAFLIPRGRKLNEDKIVFQKYEEAALYCGLDIVDLGHLCGPTMVQGKVWYRVAGPITHTQTGIAEIGISLYTSWLVPFV